MGVRESMRRALPAAMKARDRAAVNALRSALAAVENAEAVPDDGGTAPQDGVIAGAVQGLGAAEATRRELTEGQVVAIVEAEIADRRGSADDYGRRGRDDRAARLRAEAEVLAGHLGGE